MRKNNIYAFYERRFVFVFILNKMYQPIKHGYFGLPRERKLQKIKTVKTNISFAISMKRYDGEREGDDHIKLQNKFILAVNIIKTRTTNKMILKILK